MGLTFADGPLAKLPDSVNFEIHGPKHRLLFQAFPRRVRGELGGQTVLDTTAGMLLHESNFLPKLYVPSADIAFEHLRPSEHTTQCPFKGDAFYWHVEAGGRVAENAVWSYPEPIAESSWLLGYFAFHFDKLDAWYDEDERVLKGLRDPYHRVDARRSSRKVRILAGDEVVAESDRPVVVSETGLPNRWYLPPDSVDPQLLERSETTSACPYKGTAEYRSLRLADRVIEDAAWLYPEPLENVLKAGGHLCFLADGLRTEVDGEPA